MKRLPRVASALLTITVATAVLGGVVATRRAGAAVSAAVSHSLPGGRTYTLSLSPWIRGRQPLVIALHGANQTSATAEQMTGLDNYLQRGIAVAYGQAASANRRWNAGSCCGSTDQNDVAYVRALVADVARLTPIDLTRVYVVGFSNGAMLAWRLACEARDLVAAVVVVAGALLVPCATTPAVRAYHVHGVGDRTVPLRGGVGFEGHTFPDSTLEPTLVGPGSTIHQHWWTGGHSWPPWATRYVLPWLMQYRVVGVVTPPAHPGPPRPTR
jgi:poly(3-hydroxybutyrate) depolymerase